MASFDNRFYITGAWILRNIKLQNIRYNMLFSRLVMRATSLTTLKKTGENRTIPCI